MNKVKHSGWVVGLTGGIGAGKTRVSRLLSEHGVPIVDTDELAHALTQPNSEGAEALRAQFGAKFFDKEGRLDRAALRAHVFANPSERACLEGLLHPLILQAACAAVDAGLAVYPYVVVVIPLLIRPGGILLEHWREWLNQIWVVDCDPVTQQRRAMVRDGLSQAQAQTILEAQASRAERLMHADAVIVNEQTTSPIELAQQVEQLHQLALVRSHVDEGS